MYVESMHVGVQKYMYVTSVSWGRLPHAEKLV